MHKNKMEEKEMKTAKQAYEAPQTQKVSVALEGSVCAAASYVVKDDAMQNGEVTISEQAKGADGTEFEINTFE